MLQSICVCMRWFIRSHQFHVTAFICVFCNRSCECYIVGWKCNVVWNEHSLWWLQRLPCERLRATGWLDCLITLQDSFFGKPFFEGSRRGKAILNAGVLVPVFPLLGQRCSVKFWTRNMFAHTWVRASVRRWHQGFLYLKQKVDLLAFFVFGRICVVQRCDFLTMK